MRTPIIAALFLGVILAGCVGGDPDAGGPTDPTDPDQIELQAGKGAIAGLLVDDRFRPIHLTEDPETEFDTTGFILLQETGEQVKTTENGEFVYVDLEPGTYTLRVQAAQHEAVPQKISVVEGQFAEASVVARRVLSDGSSVITEEYYAFSPCFINFVALSYTADCTGDESGESFRPGITSRNVSNLPDITWIVAEAKFNQEPQNGAAYDVVIRRDIDHDYTAGLIYEGDYMKLHLHNGHLTPDETPVGTPINPWFTHNGTFEMLMFGRGFYSEEIRQGYAPVREALQMGPCIPAVVVECYQDIPMRRGAGGTLGNEAQFLLTIFLGEPEVDPLAYCAICE